MTVPVTLVEVGPFLRNALSLLTEDDLDALTFEIARNPRQGVVIPGTGGVRKIRWAIRGGGKRRGARVIYYYHDDRMPIFLLAIYAKNEKVNLSQPEKNEIRKLVRELVSQYKERG